MARVVLALVALIVAGCGESTEEVVARLGPAAFERLAQIAKAGELAQSLPNAAALPPPGEPIRFTVGESLRSTAAADAFPLYEEDLEALDTPGNVYARLPGGSEIADCASVVAHRTLAYDADDANRWSREVTADVADEILARCARLRVVFLVRTLVFAPPAGPFGADGRSRCSVEPCVFDGGFIQAEARAFALAPQRYLGRFDFEAESSPKVRLGQAEADLRENLHQAFTRSLAAAFPDAHRAAQ